MARRNTHCSRAKCTLSPPLPTSLPSHRCARSALQNVSVQCTVRLAAAEVECACPSPTRMGETAPRRRCKQDHRPIAFSGKRWSAGRLLPSPVQYPHTCRPGFLAGEKFWVVFCQTAVGVSVRVGDWGPAVGGVESRWPAGGSTHCFHWFPGVTHHSTGSGRGDKRGRGLAPKCRQVSPKCLLVAEWLLFW